MKTGKIWGTTEVLLRTPLLEVHRLYVLPWAKCSLHKHQYKHNAFYVQSGMLYIDVQKNDYALTDLTVLKPGEFTVVKPTEFHRFYTKDEPVLGLELYYPEGLSDDIVRSDCGSIGWV